MKILYISADPGIDVDKTTGGGSHIHETIRHLRQMGHEVLLVASGTGRETEHVRRVVKHTWFPGLIRIKSKVESRAWKEKSWDTSNGKKGVTSPPARKERNVSHAIQCNGSAADATPAGKGRDAKQGRMAKRGKNAIEPGTFKSSLSRRNSFKTCVMEFLYGPFQQWLNRLEEQTHYRTRFVKTVDACIEGFHPHGVYERYALGHHGVYHLCCRSKLPHILEVNALLAREARKLNRLHPWTIRWMTDRECSFLSTAATVFVVSEKLKTDIGPANPGIIVNPNGVDAGVFDPRRSLADIKKKYGIQGKPVVGWIGSFSSGRGLGAFLKIAEKLFPLVPDIRFLVVGDGPLRTWVEAEVQRMGIASAVILTGAVPRDRVPQHIDAMDVALAPYSAHGAAYFSPLKVFEYMAMAKAVVATDVGQCDELLKEGAGLVLPPDSPSLWADAVRDLLNDPRKRASMGSKARERVLARYTWNHNTRRIVEQFTRLRQEISH